MSAVTSPAAHDEVDTLEHQVVTEPRARVARLERRRARRRAADERAPGRGAAAARCDGATAAVAGAA